MKGHFFGFLTASCCALFIFQQTAAATILSIVPVYLPPKKVAPQGSGEEFTRLGMSFLITKSPSLQLEEPLINRVIDKEDKDGMLRIISEGFVRLTRFFNPSDDQPIDVSPAGLDMVLFKNIGKEASLEYLELLERCDLLLTPNLDENGELFIRIQPVPHRESPEDNLTIAEERGFIDGVMKFSPDIRSEYAHHPSEYPSIRHVWRLIQRKGHDYTEVLEGKILEKRIKLLRQKQHLEDLNKEYLEGIKRHERSPNNLLAKRLAELKSRMRNSEGWVKKFEELIHGYTMVLKYTRATSP